MVLNYVKWEIHNDYKLISNYRFQSPPTTLGRCLLKHVKYVWIEDRFVLSGGNLLSRFECSFNYDDEHEDDAKICLSLFSVKVIENWIMFTWASKGLSLCTNYIVCRDFRYQY